MSAWMEWGVALGVVLAVPLVLVRIARIEHRRQVELKALCARTLDDLDLQPEFAVSPADWPLRESPPPELVRPR